MRILGLKGLPSGPTAPWAGRLVLLVEGALVLLLALQLARLLWAIAAPTASFGDWRARTPTVPGPQARQALFAAFDPFYRLAPAGDGAVQQITSLPLQLFGIKFNEGSGLGSAIIADESGVQRSYAVGEEITPGVALKSVAYDHVVIERDGVAETLFIDQSGAVAPAASGGAGEAASAMEPPPSPISIPAPGAANPMTPEALLASVDMAPRLEKGAVTGIVVSARGNGAGFAQAGFQPGDIVVQVNGRPIRGADDINALRGAITPAARVTLMVERGAATIPIAIILPGKK